MEQSERILLGVVSVHPHYPPDDFDPTAPCRYFITSPRFDQMFPHVTEVEVFNHILSYCSWKKRGPLGSGEVILTDLEGTCHQFQFETFSNCYDALTLGVHQKPCAPIF